jgi:hypothetical protein
MDLSLKIDKVENISQQQFKESYLEPQRPLIIKGLTKNTYAGKLWSIDYFKKTMGHHEVDIYDNSNQQRAASANTSPDLKMRFADYLDIIRRDEHTDLRIFLFNMFKLNPYLKDEFPCPQIFKGFLDDIGYMFFGGKDTTVRIHYDIDMSNVLHTQFAGRKRVVLIAPQYTDLLYCLPLNTYSLIDPLKPDYKKYPALSMVKGYDVVLEPGDSLFMPSGYWHYMTYLEGGFSISYRKIAQAFGTKLEGMNNICLAMPLDKLCNKIMGSRWLKTKQEMANKRALNAMKNIYVHTPSADSKSWAA